MLAPKESRNLRKNSKRLIWFLLPTFVLDAFICFLFFQYTPLIDMPVLAGFIIICITGVLYLLFLFICAKIDKKKKAKLELNKNKDPFSKD